MELVVTIDAEEDQWGVTPSGTPSVTNIQQVPALQLLLNDYHIVPTYLLTYPVANDEKAAAVFRELLDAGQCEIGMHCHPWTTPPHEEGIALRPKLHICIDRRYHFRNPYCAKTFTAAALRRNS